MTKTSEDMALQALINAATEVSPELDTEIVRLVYAIERACQFDDSRDLSLKRIQKLVEDLVIAGASA